MVKRKAATSATGAGRRRKRTKTTTSDIFVWNPRQWKKNADVTHKVSIMAKISDRKQKVVKKVLRVPEGAEYPHELETLLAILGCSRIVTPIGYSPADPDAEHDTVLFEHFPLGDLVQWKEIQFSAKNWKPVPESYIWRFFLQMSQALTVLQNQIGPDRKERAIILHRDIKPKNILVVKNDSSTYPSFKLHDFDCGVQHNNSRARLPQILGTFDWQPPEVKLINTKAAEIWALGACVHYLATGTAPIRDPVEYGAEVFAQNNRDPDAVQDYGGPDNYYAAHAPRIVIPINLSQAQQQRRGFGPYFQEGADRYNPQYSDELNNWMKQCLRTAPVGRPTAARLVNEMGAVAKDMLKKMGGKSALVDLEIQYD
jgi:serine/threonine protein kinase